MKQFPGLLLTLGLWLYPCAVVPEQAMKTINVLEGSITVPEYYNSVVVHKGKTERNEKLVPSQEYKSKAASIMFYLGKDPPFVACAKKDAKKYLGMLGKKEIIFYSYNDSLYSSPSHGHTISQACTCIGQDPCYCQIFTKEISAAAKGKYNDGPVIFISIDGPSEKAAAECIGYLKSYRPHA